MHRLDTYDRCYPKADHCLRKGLPHRFLVEDCVLQAPQGPQHHKIVIPHHLVSDDAQ